MKEAIDKKAYYYFDEAGTPNILGHRGVNLVSKGFASRYFIIGYLETLEPKKLSKALSDLRKELIEDPYLSQIPSMSSTAKMFHANKDCKEVHEKVFKVLKEQNFTFYCIVARKKLTLFKRKFDLIDSRLYEYLVSMLLQNRLHIYKDIDCYFSSMKNVVRQDNMEKSIRNAIAIFKNKWRKDNTSNIRVIIQKSSEEPNLQAADYMLWTVFRAFERNDIRYFDFMKDKIKLVLDVFDNNGRGTYYTSRNPLSLDKISPMQD